MIMSKKQLISTGIVISLILSFMSFGEPKQLSKHSLYLIPLASFFWTIFIKQLLNNKMSPSGMLFGGLLPAIFTFLTFQHLSLIDLYMTMPMEDMKIQLATNTLFLICACMLQNW